ncbi:MAG TPA: hypothetical protein VHO29_18335 [Marmoricola sp.]|nr:hypothetical protein [Marmoricola sp.]
MSSLVSQARSRAPRLAEAAVEKARLTLVPSARPRARRTPFAVLVLAMLGAGVVGLLMFNTHMQQGSFYVTRLQNQADDLTARQQKLDMELERLRAPQRLAEAGKRLGMVAPGVPAFVKLSDGTVVGTPTPATPDEAVRINPLPAQLPAPLRPKPIIVRVPAPADPAQTTSSVTGAAAGTAQPPAATAPTTQSATRKHARGAGR